MNQLQRDERAILAVLSKYDAIPMSTINLHAGEGLFLAMQSLISKGEVKVIDHEKRGTLYEIADQGD